MTLYESRILLVDDERQILNMVKELCIKEGYRHIDTALGYREALKIFGEGEYELVLLDVMLPHTEGFYGDGFDLFREFAEIGKKRNRNVPVIFLSARDEDKDRLKGLGLGADDYITKPFLPEELLLRMKAVLRRVWQIYEADRSREARIGNAVVDWDAGTVTKGEISTMLTAKEWLLLKKLWENRGRIVSIDALCDTLWPDGSYGYENSLMVHIRRLREKIEDHPSKPENLITVRGLGYKLK